MRVLLLLLSGCFCCCCCCRSLWLGGATAARRRRHATLARGFSRRARSSTWRDVPIVSTEEAPECRKALVPALAEAGTGPPSRLQVHAGTCRKGCSCKIHAAGVSAPSCLQVQLCKLRAVSLPQKAGQRRALLFPFSLPSAVSIRISHCGPHCLQTSGPAGSAAFSSTAAAAVLFSSPRDSLEG